jgi:uncharacterized protein YecE (DUF72 family)
MADHAELRIGASSFSAKGWVGPFYPAGTKPADFLQRYAERYNTVEVDSTFYASPAPSTVIGWRDKTPENFVFALKIPQEITHGRVLENCEEPCREFFQAVDLLGHKLGPLLFQFGYFPPTIFQTLEEFLARLLPFLDSLPKGYKFAVEIRNRDWLVPQFADALRERNIALALVDQAWMPPIARWFEKFDPITADFAYVRLLGDRTGIEKLTKTFDATVMDRSKDIAHWTDVCQQIVRRGIQTYVYVNNHYGGFAPADIDKFLSRWNS